VAIAYPDESKKQHRAWVSKPDGSLIETFSAALFEAAVFSNCPFVAIA
jgi:hypothetical protein